MIVGPSQGNTRAARVGEFVQQVRMSLTVQEQCGVVLLKRNQYIAHMPFTAIMTRADAEARWSSDIDDPAIKKNGIGQDTDVPVVLPRVTEGVRAKMASSQIAVAHTVANETEMSAATKRMRFSAMARALRW